MDMLRSLVGALRNAGLILNVSKTELCRLCLSGDQDADVEFHFPAAICAFWANERSLCDKHEPVALRIKFFDHTGCLFGGQGIGRF